MYRKFIDDGRLSIRLLALLDGEEDPTFDQPVRVNDPLYLMRNSSTPAPFETEPMFRPWGDENEVFSIDYDGATHYVVVRMTENVSRLLDHAETFAHQNRTSTENALTAFASENLDRGLGLALAFHDPLIGPHCIRRALAIADAALAAHLDLEHGPLHAWFRANR